MIAGKPDGAFPQARHRARLSVVLSQGQPQPAVAQAPHQGRDGRNGFADLKKEFGFPVLIDIRTEEQFALVAKAFDVLQIPAFPSSQRTCSLCECRPREAGIIRRRLFDRPISIVQSFSGCGGAISSDAAGSDEVESGTELIDAETFKKPLQYSRRQRVNVNRDNP